MELANTERRLGAFRREMEQRIDSLYDTERVRTAPELLELIKRENLELMKLNSDIFYGGKEAALAGMGKDGDGVPHPDLLWAKRIGTAVEKPVFVSIRQEVPREDEYETVKAPAAGADRAGGASAGKAAGTAIAGIGVVVSVTAVILSPVRPLLLVLGIVAVAGGFALRKTGAGTEKDAVGSAAGSAAPQNAETAGRQVREILIFQRTENKKILRAWCDRLLELIREAIRQEEKESQNQREGNTNDAVGD